MNMVLIGNLPASLAAIGAADTPPIINPSITCQWLRPINEKKEERREGKSVDQV